MKRADPPPPTSLEGQFLIAMPSLREGPFARSVVYMCAHRDDGAMGIIINHRAEEIDFGQLLVQLDIVPRRRRSACRRAPRRSRFCAAGRSRPDGASCCIRADYGVDDFDGEDRRQCLPDRDDRHPARHRQGDRTGACGAGARLRGLEFGPARERNSRQRLAHLPGRSRAHLRSKISPTNTTRRWRSSASTRRCSHPTPATPEGGNILTREAGDHAVAVERRRRQRRPYRMVEWALQPDPRLRRDLEHLGPALELRERRRIRAGEEHLAAEARRARRRAPRGGADRNGPRFRRGAQAARCPTSRRPGARARARARR